MSSTVQILETRVATLEVDIDDLHDRAAKAEKRGAHGAAEMARVGAKAMRSARLSCIADLLALGGW